MTWTDHMDTICHDCCPWWSKWESGDIDNTKYKVVLYGEGGRYPSLGAWKTLRAQSKCIIVTTLSIVTAKYTLVIMIMLSLIVKTELETYMLSMWVFKFVSFSPKRPKSCSILWFAIIYFWVFISPCSWDFYHSKRGLDVRFF